MFTDPSTYLGNWLTGDSNFEYGFDFAEMRIHLESSNFVHPGVTDTTESLLERSSLYVLFVYEYPIKSHQRSWQKLFWPQCRSVLRSRSELVLFGRSRSRCKDVKAKTCFLLLFSLFLYEKEPVPVKKNYLEPEPVKKGPAPQHWGPV